MKKIQDQELSVFMPMKIKRRGGHRMVLVPEQFACEESIDQTLLKALVRAHLWRRQLQSGKYQTVQDLCRANRITARYVQLILRLNFLSPSLKELILKGRQPRHIKLADVIKHIAMLWCEQSEIFDLNN